MPVVITDYTNKVWAMEQPDDGLLHVGWSGQAGPRLSEVLEFISTRQKQFDAFIEKKREEEERDKTKQPKRIRTILADPGNLRITEG